MATIGAVQAAQKAFDRYERQIEASRVYLQGQKALMQGTTCDGQVILATILHFSQVISLLGSLVGTPGVGAYAKAVSGDPTYDPATEFQSIFNSMVSARDNLINGFPKDVNGFIMFQKINPDGTLLNRTFTAGQLAPAVALLDSVLVLIS